MTNIERIRKMDEKALTEFLNKLHENSLYPYMDIAGWLRSEKKTPKYIGSKGIYLVGSSEYEKCAAEKEGRKPVIIERPCTIIKKMERYQTAYCQIIVGKQLMVVPAASIKEC